MLFVEQKDRDPPTKPTSHDAVASLVDDIVLDDIWASDAPSDDIRPADGGEPPEDGGGGGGGGDDDGDDGTPTDPAGGPPAPKLTKLLGPIGALGGAGLTGVISGVELATLLVIGLLLASSALFFHVFFKARHWMLNRRTVGGTRSDRIGLALGLIVVAVVWMAVLASALIALVDSNAAPAATVVLVAASAVYAIALFREGRSLHGLASCEQREGSGRRMTQVVVDPWLARHSPSPRAIHPRKGGSGQPFGRTASTLGPHPVDVSGLEESLRELVLAGGEDLEADLDAVEGHLEPPSSGQPTAHDDAAGPQVVARGVLIEQSCDLGVGKGPHLLVRTGCSGMVDDGDQRAARAWLQTAIFDRRPKAGPSEMLHRADHMCVRDLPHPPHRPPRREAPEPVERQRLAPDAALVAQELECLVAELGGRDEEPEIGAHVLDQRDERAGGVDVDAARVALAVHHQQTVGRPRDRTAGDDIDLSDPLAEVEHDPVVAPIIDALDMYGNQGRFYYLDHLGDSTQAVSPDQVWQHIEDAAMTDPRVAALYRDEHRDPRDSEAWDRAGQALRERTAIALERVWIVVAVSGRHRVLGETGTTFGFEVHPEFVGRQ